mmetsp:Transcript_17308/g.43186  ORF Transcript_17308/g.43186 Transcript_17308/m.43186 type:complete len:255 (+) Transcript_17308:1939-2703(+)
MNSAGASSTDRQVLQKCETRLDTALFVALSAGLGFHPPHIAQDGIVNSHSHGIVVVVAALFKLLSVIDDPPFVGFHFLVVVDRYISTLCRFQFFYSLAILVTSLKTLKLGVVIGDGSRIHVLFFFQVGVGRVDDFAGCHLATLYAVVLDNLAHVLHGFKGEIVDGYFAQEISNVRVDIVGGRKTVEPEVNVGRGYPFNVKPNISRPAISNQILVFVLIPSNVASNVLRCQCDVRMGVAAPAAANFIVEDHCRVL